MNQEDIVEVAWEVSNLMNKLNDLIWDPYEEAFIDRYIKQQEQKYWEEQEKLDF